MRQVAEALAKLGRLEEACRYADECIREAEDLGIKGVILGACYETRARVALEKGDRDDFRRLSNLCAVEYKRGKNPALLNKFERLLREAEVADGSATLQRAVGDVTGTTGTRVALSATRRLSACHDADERASTVLGILLEVSGASAGMLVAQRDGGLCVLAAAGGAHPSPELLSAMESYFFGEGAADSAPADEGQVTIVASKWVDGDGRAHEPLLIVRKRHGESDAAGLAALHYDAGRASVPQALLEVLADALLGNDDVDVVTRFA
jgi:hypothetical protein